MVAYRLDYRLVNTSPNSYVECLPGSQPLASPQDALELVAACGEHQTQRLLLHAECLSKDFFDLSTRLAGEILLKFTNYYLKVAAIIPTEQIGRGKFYEFALETNRGRDFRIFSDLQKAVDWLVQD